jgi:uncharacterized protein YjbI with pentapeptide repeats
VSPNQASEVWTKLGSGQSLDGLSLSMNNGRIDVRGLTVSPPSAGKTVGTPLADVTELAGLTVIRNGIWKSLDFSGSKLDGLRFFDCIIENCVFDKCRCQDWRMWGTAISDTTFQSADLRGAALGGVQDGKRNQFRKVGFASADLRRTAYEAAEFVECTFKDTRLDKVDFQTTVFRDCVFEGELLEVLFYRTGFRGESYPPNNMERVDFSRAKLRFVEFRGLDLDQVQLPAGDDHIVLRPYREILDRLIRGFSGKTDPMSKGLAGNFQFKLKWAGPRQVQGVLNKKDLLEIGGKDAVQAVLQVLQTS